MNNCLTLEADNQHIYYTSDNINTIFLSLKQKPKRRQLLLFESIDAENQVKFCLPEMVQPEEIIFKFISFNISAFTNMAGNTLCIPSCNHSDQSTF